MLRFVRRIGIVFLCAVCPKYALYYHPPPYMEESQQIHDFHLNPITDGKEILSVLTDSQREGGTVGINAPLLGRLTCITSVQSIIFDDVVWIILNPYDMSGYMLNVVKLRLDDISSVIPFASKLENPFIKLSDPGAPMPGIDPLLER